MLKSYRTCNPTVRFSKYEFNNKLLGSITLFRLGLSIQSDDLTHPKVLIGSDPIKSLVSGWSFVTKTDSGGFVSVFLPKIRKNPI